jgi:hypothetical protein
MTGLVTLRDLVLHAVRRREHRPSFVAEERRAVGCVAPDGRDPIMTRDEALAFAREWVAAWNAHDLARILSHYADDFEMTSPFIASLAGQPAGTPGGKEAVGAYWRGALELFPDLHFELVDGLVGVGSVAICYEGVRGVRACEVLLFDRDGRVVRAIAHYDGL